MKNWYLSLSEVFAHMMCQLKMQFGAPLLHLYFDVMLFVFYCFFLYIILCNFVFYLYDLATFDMVQLCFICYDLYRDMMF